MSTRFRNREDRVESTLRIASRSIWKERFTRNFSFYCPMCACSRRIGMHPRPGRPIHFAQVGLTAIIVTLGLDFIWPWIGARGLVSFIPLWIAFEVVYRAKIRSSVICQQCGFDPVLYLSDIDLTRVAIRDHWRKRFEERGIPFPETPLEIHASRQRRAASNSENRDAPGSQYPRNTAEKQRASAARTVSQADAD